MNEELLTEIKEQIRYNYYDSFDLLKDAIIIYLRISFSEMDIDLKNNVKLYFVESVKKYYLSLKNHRDILRTLKSSNLEEDSIDEILGILEDVTTARYRSYDSFLSGYQDILNYDDFNQYNYRFIVDKDVILDEEKKAFILQRLPLN